MATERGARAAARLKVQESQDSSRSSNDRGGNGNRGRELLGASNGVSSQNSGGLSSYGQSSTNNSVGLQGQLQHLAPYLTGLGKDYIKATELKIDADARLHEVKTNDAKELLAIQHNGAKELLAIHHNHALALKRFEGAETVRVNNCEARSREQARDHGFALDLKFEADEWEARREARQHRFDLDMKYEQEKQKRRENEHHLRMIEKKKEQEGRENEHHLRMTEKKQEQEGRENEYHLRMTEKEEKLRMKMEKKEFEIRSSDQQRKEKLTVAKQIMFTKTGLIVVHLFLLTAYFGVVLLAILTGHYLGRKVGSMVFENVFKAVCVLVSTFWYCRLVVAVPDAPVPQALRRLCLSTDGEAVDNEGTDDHTD